MDESLIFLLSKRIPFAVSTNFEELKIFCVEQENAICQITLTILAKN